MRGTVETHEVDLNILSCRQVEVSVGVFIGYICDPLPLGEGHLSVGQFDAHHLYAGLPLSVHPPGQSQAAEFFLGHTSFAEGADLLFQLDDVAFDDGVLQFGPETLHVGRV